MPNPRSGLQGVVTPSDTQWHGITRSSSPTCIQNLFVYEVSVCICKSLNLWKNGFLFHRLRCRTTWSLNPPACNLSVTVLTISTLLPSIPVCCSFLPSSRVCARALCLCVTAAVAHLPAAAEAAARPGGCCRRWAALTVDAILKNAYSFCSCVLAHCPSCLS